MERREQMEMNLDVSPPEFKAKSEFAYEELRKAIMRGTLKPGDKLLPDQLSAMLKVGRMPIREAIKRLQFEGLVDVVPQSGATVAPFTLEYVQDVYAMRAVLERFAAREAARLRSGEDLTRLQAIFQEMAALVETGDDIARLAKNKAFHKAIWQIAGNKLLDSTLSALADSVERYRIQFNTSARRPSDLLQEHRELIDAIAERDTDRAEMLAWRHIEAASPAMHAYKMAANGLAGEPWSPSPSIAGS